MRKWLGKVIVVLVRDLVFRHRASQKPRQPRRSTYHQVTCRCLHGAGKLVAISHPQDPPIVLGSCPRFASPPCACQQMRFALLLAGLSWHIILVGSRSAMATCRAECRCSIHGWGPSILPFILKHLPKIYPAAISCEEAMSER
jgi:hypothetical protein